MTDVQPQPAHAEESQPNTAANGVAAARRRASPQTWSRARRFVAGRPRLSLQNKVLAGMTSTLLLLVMSAVAVYFADKEGDARDRSARAVDTLLELGRLQRGLGDAEAWQRSYLLSDDAHAVDLWRDADTSVRRSLEVLHGLARDDGDEHADDEVDVDIAGVDDAIQTKLAELSTAIDVQRERGAQAALQLVLEDGNRQTMQAARHALEQVQAKTLALRAEYQRENRRARLILILVVLVGCGLSALLNVMIQISIKNDLVERDRDAWVMAAQRDRIDESEEALDRQVRLLADANLALATRGAELEEAQGRAEELVLDLKQSNRDLAQFAYVASHDLKAPLRGIASLATWIDEDSADLNDASREHLRLLKQRIARMEAMIDGVLQYSHAGRDPAVVDVASLHELLEDIAEMATPPANVVVDVDGGDFPVTVSPVMLQQVVLNLVGNAIKHGTPKGGVVRVVAEDGDGARDPGVADEDPPTPPDGASVAKMQDRATKTPHDRGGGQVAHTSLRRGWFRVAVVDEGPGIDPRYHERIFGLFQTLQPKDRVEGAGIGLAVVKKLVELQGGWVQVDSAEGRGTSVSFTWPKHPKKRSSSSPSPQAPSPASAA